MKLLGRTENKISKVQNGKNVAHFVIWFTDQNSQPLETEDRINLTLVIK